MDSTAITTIVAALTRAWNKKPGTERSPPPQNTFGNVTAGGNAVVAGGDAILVQQSGKDRFFSQNGAQL